MSETLKNEHVHPLQPRRSGESPSIHLQCIFSVSFTFFNAEGLQ